MIVFELTMSDTGSWNGKWSQAGYSHYASRRDSEVPKEVIGREFSYRWPDGWCACISVKKVSRMFERELMRKSVGFCGYEWMIDSIINHGKIQREA